VQILVLSAAVSCFFAVYQKETDEILQVRATTCLALPSAAERAAPHRRSPRRSLSCRRL
jgi:hypothetical protein